VAEVEALLPGEPEAVAVLAAGGNILPHIPDQATLRRWYDAIPERTVNRHGPCIAALTSDIELLRAAIAATRSLLRLVGGNATVERSYIGYLQELSDSMEGGGEIQQVSITHVRYVGDDLDWDGVPGDDVESTIAFGEVVFLDTRYRIDRIGTEVYAPVFGCGSLADLPEVQETAERLFAEDAELGAMEGLPPADASDVLDLLLYTEACGDFDDEDDHVPDDRLTTTLACQAIISRYRELRRAGADEETISQWLESIRHRVSMTLADAYRGLPLIFGSSETSLSTLGDLTRDDTEVYGEGRVLEGFFARSLAGADLDYDRVGVIDEDSGDPLVVTENEKDLIAERQRRILAYVESLSTGSFSRDG